MSPPQLERLREHSHRLRLYQIENELTARLEQARKGDFLRRLSRRPADARGRREKREASLFESCIR
jgi:hypothetical protein